MILFFLKCFLSIINRILILWLKVRLWWFLRNWEMFCKPVLFYLPPDEALIRIGKLRWQLKDYPDDNPVTNSINIALGLMEVRIKEVQEHTRTTISAAAHV